MRAGTIRKKGPYVPNVTSLYKENYTVQMLEQTWQKRCLQKFIWTFYKIKIVTKTQKRSCFHNLIFSKL
jgi:hypothetical protein